MTQPACPLRIELPRVVLRCWEPGDEPLRKETADRNREHVSPFMAWGRQPPEPLEVLQARLGQDRAEFLSGVEWRFGIFSPGEDELWGGISIFRRDAETLEIGFWIDRDRTGRGLVTEAAGRLTEVAVRELGAGAVEIRCDARNTRSAAVARRLGYRLVREFEECYEGTDRTTAVWRLEAADLP